MLWDVPTPKARAPNAPLVHVWLSPQITVWPGSTMPCSGAVTWTIPCVPLVRSRSRMPTGAPTSARASHMVPPNGLVAMVRSGSVDTRWSGVANTRSGSAHRQAPALQLGHRRRPGQVVEEVAVDMQQRPPFFVQFLDHVAVPQLVE